MMLVIGYGNTLRGDDGIGPYLVEALSGQWPAEEVELLALPQLTPELAEPISRAQAVIFIDSCLGQRPGQIKYQALSPASAPGQSHLGSFTHAVDPAGLLHSARALYGQWPPAYLYGVTGEAFALGAGFSAAVAAAIPAVLAMIQDKIVACTNTPSPVRS